MLRTGQNNTYKQIFKTYFKNTGKRNLAEFIYVKKARTKIPDIFTRQEILKMIETAQHPMYKALISALYETGCRTLIVQELAKQQKEVVEKLSIIIVPKKIGILGKLLDKKFPFVTGVEPRKRTKFIL